MFHALADPILRFPYHSHHVYCPKSFCSTPHTLILMWNAADPCLMPGMCHNAARGQMLQFRLTFHTYACKDNSKKPNIWVRKHHERFLQHESTIQHIHSESILQWFVWIWTGSRQRVFFSEALTQESECISRSPLLMQDSLTHCVHAL